MLLHTRRRVRSFADVCLFGALLLFVGYGPVLFTLQVLHWLRTGTWVPLPVSLLFLPMARPAGGDEGIEPLGLVPQIWLIWRSPAFEAWLRYPTSWLGLHKIVAGLLDSVSVPALTLCVSLLVVGRVVPRLLDRASERAAERDRPTRPYRPQSPPPPGTYRFRLPSDLAMVWDLVDRPEGQCVRAVFDQDHPLVITSSTSGQRVGEGVETCLSSVKRERGTGASDLDDLLTAMGEKHLPVTTDAYCRQVMMYGGREFDADVAYSWHCDDQRGTCVRDSTGAVQIPDGWGCGATFDMESAPKNADGTVPYEITCSCGALLSAAVNLQNIRE